MRYIRLLINVINLNLFSTNSLQTGNDLKPPRFSQFKLKTNNFKSVSPVSVTELHCETVSQT